MAKIIEFRKRKVTNDSSERLRALVEGRIRQFDCENCGEVIEVIDNKFPKICPGCGLELDWDDESEEHI